jgi:hypothetical protein
VTFLRVLALVRLGLVPLALTQLLALREEFPPRYEAAAWIALAAQLAAALALFVAARRWRGRRRNLAVAGIAADTALSIALIFVYSFQTGQPLRTLLFLVVLEAALFFRERGGLVVAVDVLPQPLVADPQAPFGQAALAIIQAEHQVRTEALLQHGVPVIGWTGGADATAFLHRLALRQRRRSTRTAR